MLQVKQRDLPEGNRELYKAVYKTHVFLITLFLFLSLGIESVFSAVEKWNVEGLGNHRVLLQVSKAAKAAKATIPWRRTDPMPELKGIVIIPEGTTNPLNNIWAETITPEQGIIYFEAPSAGNYYLYYMPYKTVKKDWNSFPRYLQTTPPFENWLSYLKTLSAVELEQANVIEFQSSSLQNEFSPLSIPASEKEVTDFLEALSATNTHLLFYPEPIETPIQLRHQIPLIWTQKLPQASYTVNGYPGEYLAFQLGVVAANKDIANFTIGFGSFKGNEAIIDGNNMTCFNLQGIDYRGNEFSKNIFLEKHKQIPLWIGLQIPNDIPHGNYKGNIYFSGWNLRHTPFPVEIIVKPPQQLTEKELSAESNLNWLNSDIGLDTANLFSDFPNIEKDENCIKVNHQQMNITSSGLPDFIDFRVKRDGVWCDWTHLSCEFVENTEKNEISWLAQNSNKGLLLECNGMPQRDGLCQFVLQIHAYANAQLDDISLSIKQSNADTQYFMGLGKKGGKVPESFRWDWNTKNANSYFWLGNGKRGIWLKFLGLSEPKDPYFMEKPHQSWAGTNNIGYIDFSKNSERIEISTHTQAIYLAKGETATFRFNLMQTPLRPLNDDILQDIDKTTLFRNWTDNVSEQTNPLEYLQDIESFASKTKKNGEKFYLPLSAREVPYQIQNFWAFHMLDNEIFQYSTGILGELQHYGANYWSSPIPFIGDSWLCEHIGTGYRAYWLSKLRDGRESTTIGIEPLGRYQNYFLETADSVLKKVQVDGLRITPMTRTTVMRLKNILKTRCPNAKLVMTTGDNFTPENGMNNPLAQYMELLPWIDAIYFSDDLNGLDKNYLYVEKSGQPMGVVVLNEKKRNNF